MTESTPTPNEEAAATPSEAADTCENVVTEGPLSDEALAVGTKALMEFAARECANLALASGREILVASKHVFLIAPASEEDGGETEPDGDLEVLCVLITGGHPGPITKIQAVLDEYASAVSKDG